MLFMLAAGYSFAVSDDDDDDDDTSAVTQHVEW